MMTNFFYSLVFQIAGEETGPRYLDQVKEKVDYRLCQELKVRVLNRDDIVGDYSTDKRLSLNKRKIYIYVHIYVRMYTFPYYSII